ncbi:helix-turn-helix transcriptional regulator [Clostridium botulinum D/C]|nr:helix-turn-helix transcriptional regulator [Clostridium botulinum D/C]MCD3360677.1 helix-turn-helix transcriptional regulator [Clostridium botulinum D/C]MCD3362103.1 helix-turn-helix transcriptional regulator [Clostridium botulinum D/C]MCD3366455.1 helix-turn-helix transcriptional regulator [Clostridium botulinum D/C]
MKNITQSQLARKSCISRSYLSEIESGKKIPSKEVASKLGSALKICPNKFMIWVRKY